VLGTFRFRDLQVTTSRKLNVDSYSVVNNESRAKRFRV